MLDLRWWDAWRHQQRLIRFGADKPWSCLGSNQPGAFRPLVYQSPDIA
jgi:hypothetical protein